MNEPLKDSKLLGFLYISGLALLILSGVEPNDRLTWVLEVFPVAVAAVVLPATYKRFPFSGLAYLLIWVHASILILGGHWTYAEMPLFNWIRDAFHLARNYYDRVGHFAQGFVPAILAREILLRTSPLRRGKWLFFITISICLAISALYELLEWGAAITIGESAEQFLATQGDVWDTQWDMFLAGCGAMAALILLSRLHDRSLAKLGGAHRK